MSSKIINIKNIIFFLTFFFLLINIAKCTVLIKAANEMTFSCDKNVYYIIIDVIFSGKPQQDQYSFTLNLATPDKLNFKCMLDYPKKQLYCFRAFSDEEDYIEKDTYLQLPYPFPEIDDIEWDYESFLKNVYRKVWNANTTCGEDNIFNRTDPNYEEWKIEGKISHLENGQCKPASITKEEIHKYLFDINVSFEKGQIIELLKKQNSEIELLQEIWVPLLPREEKQIDTIT